MINVTAFYVLHSIVLHNTTQKYSVTTRTTI